MNVTQIFLSDQNAPMGSYLESCVREVQNCFRGEHHRVFNDAEVQKFLREHYDSAVQETYKKLIPFAYKADLARLCIVNRVGGWYFDIAVRCINRVKLAERIDFLVFRDLSSNSRYTRTVWPVQSAVFYSKPDHPVLKRAISMIVENCSKRYYGLTSLCPTGPNVLGRALALQGISEYLAIGDYRDLTPERPKKNLAFLAGDGTIMAFGKEPSIRDLSAIGASGTNSYSDLWERRSIYHD